MVHSQHWTERVFCVLAVHTNLQELSYLAYHVVKTWPPQQLERWTISTALVSSRHQKDWVRPHSLQFIPCSQSSLRFKILSQFIDRVLGRWRKAVGFVSFILPHKLHGDVIEPILLLEMGRDVGTPLGWFMSHEEGDCHTDQQYLALRCWG